MSSKKARKSKPAAAASKTPRITVKLDYPNEETFIEEHAPNLSKTGIFIESKRPRAVGTTLRFELQLSDGTPLLKGKGSVTWKRTDSPSGTPPGMGIKYLQLNEQGKALIKKVMAYKASHGDQFDKPSRYSMAPPPDEPKAEKPVESNEDAPDDPKANGKQKKKKMKKIDLNELDAMLDDIALSKVSTKKRTRYRRRDIPTDLPEQENEREASHESLTPREQHADTLAPSTPAVPMPSVPPEPAAKSVAATQDPGSPIGTSETDAPGVMFDEDEFDADVLDADLPAASGSVAPAAIAHERVSAPPLSSVPPNVEIERISQDEISNIADVEELNEAMEIEADLLEPDEDSGPPPSRDSANISEDELASVLEDVYGDDTAHPEDEMIQEDELDDLLSALEEPEENGDDPEEIEEIDVLEIEEEI